MFNVFGFWRAVYLANVQAAVFELSDSTTFMRYPGDGVRVIPNIPGC